MGGSLMAIPNNAGKITESDIFVKGRFKYAPWAKVTHVHNEQDERWMPGTRLNTVTGDLFHRVNDSGCVLIFFRCMSSGVETPDWLFAITDHRNQAIPFDKITCVDVQNSNRRGICSAAAAYFDTGYELWAKEEVAQAQEPGQEPQVEVLQPDPVPVLQSATPAESEQKAANTEPQRPDWCRPEPEPIRISDADKAELIDTLRAAMSVNPELIKTTAERFRVVFQPPPGDLQDQITTPAHSAWWYKNLPKPQ